MINKKPGGSSELWARRLPEREGPVRSAGGFYRTAEGKDAASGGIPLNTANDAVVAAVRLAYKVAEAQIDRSARLARRLRDAGDKAVGPGSERQALDATEKLVMKALMSGLEWWEGSVAEGRCPVKRLAAAEYQMLGSMLGLTPPLQAKASNGRSAEADVQPPTGRSSEDTGPRGPLASRSALQIVHKGAMRDRRPVLVENWEIASTSPFRTPVFFYSATDLNSGPLEAELVVTGKKGGARLILETPPKAVPGLWRGAICDDEAVQVGFVEIVL